MKIGTSIKPRRDGVVNLVGKSGLPYAFVNDGTGMLCAEISDEDDLRAVLTNGDFFPADDADLPEAEAIVRTLAGDEDETPTDDPAKPAAADTVLDLPDDDPVDLAAMPVEANTPPAAMPGRGKKRAAE